MKFKIKYTKVIENSYKAIILAKSKDDAIEYFNADPINSFSQKIPEEINVIDIKLNYIEQIS